MVIFSVLTRCFIRYRNGNFKTPRWNQYTDSESILRNNESKTVWQEQSAVLFRQLRQSLPHTDQFTSSGSQTNGSIPPAILGFPLIHGSPGQLNQSGEKETVTETGSAGTSSKQKWSVHQEWSFAVQAAPPSYDGICKHSLVVRLSLPYQATASASVQVSWYIGNKQIHDDMGVYSLPTTSDLWEFQLKVSWCGKPLSYAARLISTLTEHWPRSPKAGRLQLTTCFTTTKRRPCCHVELCPTGTFRQPWMRFSMLFPAVVSQISGYYMQRWRTAHTLPT